MSYICHILDVPSTPVINTLELAPSDGHKWEVQVTCLKVSGSSSNILAEPKEINLCNNIEDAISTQDTPSHHLVDNYSPLTAHDL